VPALVSRSLTVKQRRGDWRFGGGGDGCACRAGEVLEVLGLDDLNFRSSSLRLFGIFQLRECLNMFHPYDRKNDFPRFWHTVSIQDEVLTFLVVVVFHGHR
jgi:hypothetical protein